MAFRHDNTSLQEQPTLFCILPRHGLPSTPLHVSNSPLPGVACDPISPPLMNLINLIRSALQVLLRVARGPSSALCHLSQHLSSQQLPRQQLSTTEPHSPDDPWGKPRCHSRRVGKNRPSRVPEKTRAPPATMLTQFPMVISSFYQTYNMQVPFAFLLWWHIYSAISESPLYPKSCPFMNTITQDSAQT